MLQVKQHTSPSTSPSICSDAQEGPDWTRLLCGRGHAHQYASSPHELLMSINIHRIQEYYMRSESELL